MRRTEVERWRGEEVVGWMEEKEKEKEKEHWEEE